MLLDGPKKAQQLENLKTIVRNVGRAGIPVIGYNFSIAGVAGRVKGPFGRGGAEAVGMDGPCDTPMPNGMVWNMVYDRERPAGRPCRRRPTEQLWQRLQRFPRRAHSRGRRGRRHAGRASRRSADADRARPAAAGLPAATLPEAARPASPARATPWSSASARSPR